MLRRVLFAIFLTSLATATAADALWAAAESDLTPDPAVRQGTLPNGLRYLIRPNQEPKGRVSLRLLVAAGSVHEREDERGLAHFVEHMAFRGTRSHPNGSMATELQRLGIGFGPDSTAFTNYRYTIYHLELPDPGGTTFQKGLSVFREYAGEVTFDAALIERERGVILSEKDTRDTPDARRSLANLSFLWPHSAEVQRSPIGREASVRQFNRPQFVAFYDAWYRPERMAVIVVGDIDAAAAERMIAEELSSLVGRGSPRNDPEPPTAPSASPRNIAIFTDPGLIGASCVLEHPIANPLAPDTHARRVARLQRALAFSMLQRRITKLTAQADSTGVGAYASVGELLRGWSLAMFGMSGRISDWDKFIGVIEREHRRAFLHGFSEAELKIAKLGFTTGYEEAVRTFATWPSATRADHLAMALLEGETITTPAAIQHDLADALAAVTALDCRDAFREAWTTEAPHVFIATNPAFAVTATEVAKAFNASRAMAVAAQRETGAADFAYTDFGTAGSIIRETSLPDLDVRQAELSNGVRLNFKPTTFEADSVGIYVKVGRGRLSLPANQPGLDLLAEHLLPRGGVGRHTFEELGEILSGRVVGVSFKVHSDSFDFGARCAPRDLQLCLQLITAHLTDSAYRIEPMNEIQASFGTLYATLGAAPGGPITLYAPRILAGGDSRIGLPTPMELGARSAAEVKAWLEPEFKNSPIELSIVGDTTWEEAARAVASTLGALPARPAPDGYRTPSRLQTAKPAKAVHVYTTAPELRQVAIAWFCPVRDLTDMHHDRRCRLLAALITERLRIRLREEMGAAYSCSAEFVDQDGFPNLSYFSVYAEVAPARAEQATRLIRDELEALRKKRFTDDEFERVKRPFLREREENLRTNAYWGYTVLRDAQERPERIAAARDRAADTAALTRADIEPLARRYFDPKRCFQFVAYPGVNSQALPAFGR